MTIMADGPVAVTRPALPQRPVPHERTPDRPTPSGPRPHPQQSAARQLLDTLYRRHAPMATAVAARALRPGDRGLVDDIAQEAWLDTWQHLLRGNELRSPAGFLAMRARRRAVDHYRLARVRREEAVDYTDDTALAHLARLMGAAA
ncbi:RNA polymerase sigma factor [Streptomyces sp. NBC_00474]|uniref:RNA polymerase sigma factor n=1 Tax=Streptomyces sp. NBC_00474 TaxID=2975754 RepID=UPI00225B8BD8|nr:sigma-70 family RNA polymerase sigma factor [Streptomyces sp. NBC_00474]MCX5055096.1 sigma-70 family RNA polymerase sigma factor [Streptomyces sp. NBC_00474]